MPNLHSFRHLAQFAAVLILPALLAGCGGGNAAIRYYVLDPVAQEPLLSGNTDLAVEIRDLTIPQYLERFNIATRRDGNRLQLSETHQWGENLRKNLLRTLARNLSALLGTADVATPLNRSASLPDYRLQINIEQFERDTDGHVRLAARWQITGGENGEPLGMHTATLQSGAAVGAGDYAAIVAAMQALYGRFSRAVAASIVELEQ